MRALKVKRSQEISPKPPRAYIIRAFAFIYTSNVEKCRILANYKNMQKMASVIERGRTGRGDVEGKGAVLKKKCFEV